MRVEAPLAGVFIWRQSEWSPEPAGTAFPARRHEVVTGLEHVMPMPRRRPGAAAAPTFQVAFARGATSIVGVASNA